MLPGTLVESLVQDLRTTILVNGVERKGRWSTRGELHGDLPTAVESASGVTQTMGSIVWDQEELVRERPVHPFRASSGWVPEDGDRIEVYVSDDVDEPLKFPRFTGSIQNTVGSVKAANLVSKIIDPYPSLNPAFNYPPVIRTKPPLVDGGEWRRVSTSPVQVMVAAGARAGYRSTAFPADGEVLVDAPLQGSLWPLTGRCLEASNFVKDDGFPDQRTTASFGWGMHDFSVVYEPAAPATGTDPLQITMSVGEDNASATSIYAHYGAFDVRLRITASRVAEVWVDGTNVGGRPIGSGVTASLLVDGTSYRLWTDNGDATATLITSTARPADPLDEIEARSVAGANIAGLAVSTPSQTAFPETDPANLVMDISFEHMPVNPVIRAVESSTVRATLHEIASALLLAVHFDELGRLVFRSSDRLAMGTPARDLTTTRDVLELEWETNLLSRRSEVTVTGLAHTYANTQRRNVELHRGSGEQMENGESRQQFINVPADEEWLVELDDLPAVVADPGEPDFNTGRGSFVGSAYTSDGGDTWGWANSYTNIETVRVSYRTWRITHSVSDLPAGYSLSLQTAQNASTNLWPKYQGFELPVIRGSLVKFAEEKTETVQAATVGPALEHPVQHWAGWESGTWSHPDYLRDFIAARVTVPEPEIPNLVIHPDPRLQKGDIIRIVSPRYLGVSITAVVMGIDEDYDGVLHQVLKVRVISIAASNMTYDEWDAAAPNTVTYDQWDALAVQDYDDFTDTTEDPQ